MDRAGTVALLINSLGSGGAERTVVTLIRWLIRQRVSVQLICLERGMFYSIPDSCPVTVLSRAKGGEGSLIKLLMLPLHAVRLKRLVRKQGITVVQSHLYRANYVNALARLLGSRHRAQIVNGGQASLYKEKGVSGRVNLSLIRRLYPVAEMIVAKSIGMRRDLESILDRTAKTTVIHNPYDIERIQRLAEEEVAQSWFTSDRRVIVSVGRLIALKRQRDIIEAFGALAPVDPKLHLLFLGDGPERVDLERLASQNGTEEHIHFLGNVTNPFKYLSRAVCLVSASAGEGFPNVLVEAMICGCPVVSSDCAGGPREILAPETDALKHLESGFRVEEAGILFAVGDVTALVEALSRLLSDSRLTRRMKEAGLRRSRNFRQETVCEEYWRVLTG